MRARLGGGAGVVEKNHLFHLKMQRFQKSARLDILYSTRARCTASRVKRAKLGEGWGEDRFQQTARCWMYSVL